MKIKGAIIQETVKVFFLHVCDKSKDCQSNTWLSKLINVWIYSIT